jgi:hypothetical protein
VSSHTVARRAKKLTKKQAAALFQEAKHAAQYLQYTSDIKWHWSDMTSSRIDHAKRTMTFATPGEPILVADVRYVGVFHPDSKLFQWAWAVLDDDEPIAQLRAYGEERGLKQLTTHHFVSTESEAWTLTCLAAYVLGAESVCRAVEPQAYKYVLLSNWRRGRRAPRTVR